MTVSEKIKHALEIDGVAILPPMDVFESIAVLKDANIALDCTMLDPWYNKGYGGELPTDEYDDFITRLLNKTGEISDLMYLWGFPEIIGPYVRYAPNWLHG